MLELPAPYHVRQDTLAYLKGQPLFLARSMREVNLRRAARAVKAYRKDCGLRYPEAEAIQFYVGNAIWAELLKRYPLDMPLPPEALKLARWYVQMASSAAQRLLYYLLLIVTRESRHAHKTYAMASKHGSVFAEFNHTLHGFGHDGDGAADYFQDHAPVIHMGAYADALAWTFHACDFKGGYGGPKWAEIADTFKNMVDGKHSPEMTTDVAWALCHNNGPIFNKGMVYESYTPVELMRILDVQRGGQMIEFVRDPVLPKQHVYDTTMHAALDAVNLFPGVFGSTVDWHKVQAAGAVMQHVVTQHAPVVPQPAPVPASEGKVYWVTNTIKVPVVERPEKKAA